MDHVLPIIRILLQETRVKTYAIPPKVFYYANFKLDVLKFGSFTGYVMRICGKFEIKLVEVSLNIDTLQLWIDILIDKYEV